MITYIEVIKECYFNSTNPKAAMFLSGKEQQNFK